MTCVLQVAKALQYLHEANPQLLHRDLKSENLLLTEKGRSGDIRVMDFGLTKLRSALYSRMPVGSSLTTCIVTRI